MKNLNLLVVGLFAVVAAVLLVVGAHAGGDPSPVLRAIPQQTTMVADGTTVYSIMLEGDSTPMNGQNTRGIQAVFDFPNVPGYTFNLVSINTNPSNDFFAGFSTSPMVSGYGVWRGVNSGNGPANRTGNFVEIRFTITQTNLNHANIVQTSLGFDSDPEITYFRRPIAQGGNIPPVLDSIPFTIQPRFRNIAAARAVICDEDC